MSTKLLLTAGHLTLIRFVVVSSQMKQSVKHQHLDFNCQGVTPIFRLPPRSRNADGQIAGDLLNPGYPRSGVPSDGSWSMGSRSRL